MCIYAMGYYTAMKNKAIPPFVATWLDLGGVMLNKINQTEKDKCCVNALLGRI